jgi:hypothetical protein
MVLVILLAANAARGSLIYNFIYYLLSEDNGRVRMASQPGLRRTGKIRVTTPLATRPRPLMVRSFQVCGKNKIKLKK